MTSTPEELKAKSESLDPTNFKTITPRTIPCNVPITYKDGMDLATQILVLLEGVAILESVDEEPGKVFDTAMSQYKEFLDICQATQDSVTAAGYLVSNAMKSHTEVLNSIVTYHQQLIIENAEFDEVTIRLNDKLAKEASISQDPEG